MYVSSVSIRCEICRAIGSVETEKGPKILLLFPSLYFGCYCVIQLQLNKITEIAADSPINLTTNRNTIYVPRVNQSIIEDVRKYSA